MGRPGSLASRQAAWVRAWLAPLPLADERGLRKLVLSSVMYTTAKPNRSAACRAVMATLGCTIFGATMAVRAISKVGLATAVPWSESAGYRCIAYVTFVILFTA